MEKTFQKGLKIQFLILILLVFALLFLEGCGGKREVEQLAFVMSLGVDQGKKPDEYLLTYQIALPKTSGGGAPEIENWTISVEVENIPNSQEKVSQILNKTPFVGTSRVIVLGEDIARSGINEMLDSFQRFYQFRRTVYLLQAKGDARDILETKLRTKQLPALSFLSIIQDQPNDTSFPVTRIGHYLTVLGREGQAPVIPTVTKLKPGDRGIEYSDKEGEELQIQGAGVFVDGKLRDFLTDEEAKGYMWLDNEVKNRFLQTPEEQGISLSAWVLKSNTKYKFGIKDGKMGITFQIKTEVSLNDIKGQQGKVNDESWREFVKDLEPIVEDAILRECESAVLKSRHCQADFIGIGRKLEQKEPKYWKQVKDNWEKEFLDVPVSYEIDVVINHSGLPRNAPVSPQRSEEE